MGYVKTTIDISDSLFQEAKAWAESRGVPFRQIVEEGLRSIVQQGREPRKRFRLRDGSFDGKGLQNGRSWPDVRQTIYQGRGE
jgi:hypothetical protein